MLKVTETVTHYYLKKKSVNYLRLKLLLPTIKVREVIDVCEYVLWNVSILLQTKLKNLKGHRFILTKKGKKGVLNHSQRRSEVWDALLSAQPYFAAIVLHQRRRHVHVVTRAGILPRLLEDGTT